jgi:putative aldouronate transport system permease protein
METIAKDNSRAVKPTGSGGAKLILKDWQLYSLLVLPVIYYLIFKYLPIVGNIIAFRKYVPGGSMFGDHWVGFKYFSMFIFDQNFWNIFWNTIRISMTTLIFGFPAPIIFALLLNEITSPGFKKTVQTISYLPHFLSIVVVAGMIMDVLSPSGGIINMLIKTFTGKTIPFMQESQYFTAIYVVSDIWQGIGWGAIIYLAALTGINTELYEAAMIDGANRWRQTLHVTLPGILPTVTVMLILNLGNILNVGFEKVFLLYNPAIYDKADVLSTYLYRMAMQMNSFSYATAVGLFESVIGLVLVLFTNALSKKMSGSGLW